MSPCHLERDVFIRSHFSAAWIGLFLTLPAFAQQPGETARVSVNQVWNAFPDFVCTEKIVSSMLEKGKVKDLKCKFDWDHNGFGYDRVKLQL